MKIYIAGALFNEGEIRQRIFEEQELKKACPNLEIFNPITQPFNQDKASLPSPLDIYEGDYQAVKAADILLCDITNEDAGVMCEIGIAAELNKLVVAVNSDIRLKDAHKYQIPSYGVNHFVLGAILKHGKLFTSFSDALNFIKEKYYEN